MKFFDLRIQYISATERNGLPVKSENELLHQEKNYILAGPLRSIVQGYEVEVFKTLKANGENVQISFCKAIDCWLICSKNVALLARQADHIDIYKKLPEKDRYTYAVEIAQVWFEKLATLDGQSLSQIKREMEGITLVGEYIGSQNHQHLVKYSRITLIFYAIVDNQSDESCWPCQRSWGFFHKYGLDIVHIQSLGRFSNYGQLCDQLETTFKEVAKSSIAQDEEGNVLYFVQKGKTPTEQDKVLSLAKLKTLEYRLFRKMREKLRNFFSKVSKG